MVFLEQLPTHPNIVRYLFHTFDHEKGRARLFMTKYALSLRDEIVRRKAGVGDVAAMQWACGCCPKCATLKPGAHALPPLHFSVVEAAQILLDIAQGLYFLHFHQILHRDLKSICPLTPNVIPPLFNSFSFSQGSVILFFACSLVLIQRPKKQRQHFHEAGARGRDCAAADWGL